MDCLDGVHNQKRRFDFFDRGFEVFESSHAQEKHMIRINAQPVGPRFDLPRRFLPGKIEGFSFLFGQDTGYFQQQRGLPHPRFSPDKNNGIRHNTASQYPVEFLEIGFGPREIHLADILEFYSFHTGNAGRIGFAGSILYHGIPIITLGTSTIILWVLESALDALK